MKHRIEFIADDLMPAGKPWLICRGVEETTLYLAECTTLLTMEEKARTLEECWEGYRVMVEESAADDPGTGMVTV